MALPGQGEADPDSSSVVEVPAEDDGTVLLDTLRSQFPASSDKSAAERDGEGSALGGD